MSDEPLLINNLCTLYVNKDTIKNEILPHLSITKCGFVSKNSSIEIINVILYKLKTGYQWKCLPMKSYSATRSDILYCISIL